MADAIAVRRGRIVAIGTERDVRPLAGFRTRIEWLPMILLTVATLGYHAGRSGGLARRAALRRLIQL